LNIKTIYNPIDISPLNEKKDIINFLNVGTIKFEKNHLLLLKSFNKIHHSLNNQSKLIIVGGIESNELYKKLLHFIEKNNLEDKVVFKGAKKNVNNYYCNNNIFVLSSIYEGMSNALLEAMSLESACISTDYEGINEIIINNETGLIVQSNNIDRLASSMLKLYKSRKTRLKLGKNARLKIISDFEKNKILKQWLNVIIDTK
jgi:glycosyltransferase involved in cell wall biosynthesis